MASRVASIIFIIMVIFSISTSCLAEQDDQMNMSSSQLNFRNAIDIYSHLAKRNYKTPKFDNLKILKNKTTKNLTENERQKMRSMFRFVFSFGR